RHGTGVKRRNNRRAVRSSSIEDAADVFCPLLPGRDGSTGNGVGDTGSSTIENDEPAERCQAPTKFRHRSDVTMVVHVATQAETPEHVHWPVAMDLVTNIGVTDFDILGLRTAHG